MPGTVRRLLMKELVCVLSSPDCELRNAVIAALIQGSHHHGLQLRAPLAALLPAVPQDGAGQLVPLSIVGRAGPGELLVTGVTGDSTLTKIRPVSYTAVLQHATFEELVEVAHRVQAHMLTRTSTMALLPQAAASAAPANKALGAVAAVTLAADRFISSAATSLQAPLTP